MNNPYLPTMTKITEKVAQNASVTLFKLEGHVDFRPGQFIMLTVPGCGEAPFSLTGDLEVCVRDTGHLTHRLHAMAPGDTVGWRGPLGTSFDMAPPGPAVYIAGGIGIVPLRPVILSRPGITLLGAKTRGELVFPELATKIRTDDEGLGFLPDLIRETELPKGAVCMLCGPGGMYRPVVKALSEQGVTPERIIVSLERNMSCGIGKCGHCRAGGLRVCKDGPVFSWADIADREGLV